MTRGDGTEGGEERRGEEIGEEGEKDFLAHGRTGTRTNQRYYKRSLWISKLQYDITKFKGKGGGSKAVWNFTENSSVFEA